MNKLPLAAGYAILLPLFYSSVINACEFSNGAIQITNTLQFGTVTVARDAPVGTVIGRVMIPGSNQRIGYCPVNPFYYGMEMLLPPSAISGVYSTEVGGVGIRGGFFDSGRMYSNPIAEVRGNIAPTGIRNGKLNTFELIKTGDISPGRIPSGTVARYRLRSSAGNIESIIHNISETLIQTRSCEVLNSAINVNLGTAQRHEVFTGPGSTANAQAFSIPLNCDANTPVSITLDNVNPLADEANGVLAVNPGSTAQGVGVQVRHNNAPVQFGTLISYGNASGGNINIPFEARFYQTGDRVLPGSVNATATFTMTYR